MFNKNINKIYVDMDGVIADFDGYLYEHTGKPYREDSETWDFIKTVDNFYYKLSPTSYCLELWDAVNYITKNVEILTAIPRTTVIESAKQDKIDWVRKYLGPDIKVNFGPYSRDKKNWARENDILIDDRPSNIDEWNAAKGIGCLHFDSRPEKTFRFLTFL